MGSELKEIRNLKKKIKKLKNETKGTAVWLGKDHVKLIEDFTQKNMKFFDSDFVPIFVKKAVEFCFRDHRELFEAYLRGEKIEA